MNWFLYSLLAAIFYAVAEIIGKYIADHKSEPVYLSIIATFFSAIIGFTIVIIQKEVLFHFTPINTIGLLTSCFLTAVGIISYYAALKHCEIADFALLTRTQVLFTFLGGVFLFGETFNIQQIVGIIFVVLGVVLISMYKSKIRFQKGWYFALTTALLFSLGIFIDKSIIGNFSASFYTAIYYTGNTIFLIIPAVIAYRQHREFPSRKTFGMLFITSLLYVFSAIFFYSSYKVGGFVSLTSVIAQLQIPIVVLYGILIFKEKDRLVHKIIATILMMFGAFLLKG